MANENINKAILAIIDGCDKIPKKGYNKFHKYEFMRAVDVVEHIRPLCVKHKVVITPEVLNYEITQSGDKQSLITQRVKFTFTHSETGEFITATVLGQGADSLDKGSNKAMTGAKKYAFIEVFQLSDGEDAENDSPGNGDKQPAKKQTTNKRKEAIKKSEGHDQDTPTNRIKKLEKLWHGVDGSKEDIIKARKIKTGKTVINEMTHVQQQNYIAFLKDKGLVK